MFTVTMLIFIVRNYGTVSELNFLVKNIATGGKRGALTNLQLHRKLISDPVKNASAIL